MRHPSEGSHLEPVGVVRTEAHRLVDRGDRFFGSLGEGERQSQHGVAAREVGAVHLDTAFNRRHGALAIAREQGSISKVEVSLRLLGCIR